jgi:hypothetical protein
MIYRIIIIRTLFILLACLPMRSFANDDVFTKAVTFALTGSDSSDVKIVDRAACIFSISNGTKGNHNGDKIFHLNNVDLGRLKISTNAESYPRGSMYAMIKGLTITLHGEATVYEDTEIYQVPPEVSQAYGKDHIGPTSANDYTIGLYTDEYNRVVRAWKYIYTHGCKGSKSSF